MKQGIARELLIDGIHEFVPFPLHTLLSFLIKNVRSQVDVTTEIKGMIEQQLLQPYKEGLLYLEEVASSWARGYDKRMLDKAIDRFIAATTLVPTSNSALPTYAHMYVAVCLQISGDMVGARRWYGKARDFTAAQATEAVLRKGTLNFGLLMNGERHSWKDLFPRLFVERVDGFPVRLRTLICSIVTGKKLGMKEFGLSIMPKTSQIDEELRSGQVRPDNPRHLVATLQMLSQLTPQEQNQIRAALVCGYLISKPHFDSISSERLTHLLPIFNRAYAVPYVLEDLALGVERSWQILSEPALSRYPDFVPTAIKPGLNWWGTASSQSEVVFSLAYINNLALFLSAPIVKYPIVGMINSHRLNRMRSELLASGIDRQSTDFILNKMMLAATAAAYNKFRLAGVVVQQRDRLLGSKSGADLFKTLSTIYEKETQRSFRDSVTEIIDILVEEFESIDS